MSGSTAATVGGEAKTLSAHEGVFVPAGKPIALKAGGDIPSTLMHFLLCGSTGVDRAEAPVPATTIEVFRTPKPIPGRKVGQFNLNLTVVTFPPHTPSSPPHHRSGPALYYVLSGAGAITVAGKTEPKGVGSMIYEPSDLVHAWANPSDEPLKFIVFNLNPVGVPAIVPSAQSKTR